MECRPATDWYMTGRTCALHAGLVQDAVKDVALAILIFLLEDQSRDLDQETGQLSLQQHKPAWSACYQCCITLTFDTLAL